MTPQVRRKGISLRLLLTFLYSSLLAAVLLVVGAFVYARLQSTMLALIDRSLETALNQATEDVDYSRGTPSFSDDDVQSAAEEASRGGAYGSFGTVIRIVWSDGSVQSGLGDFADLPHWPVASDGFTTQRAGSDQWRIANRPLDGSARRTGVWLQAVQSLRFMQETLGGVLGFFLVCFPALLAVSGIAAFVLSARALQPVVMIERTAASITEGALSRRTGYTGSITEVAGLAASFDKMLERIHNAFERERRFTSDAAHELRTPLTVLKGQIEVSMAKQRSPLQHVRILRGLLQHVDRLVRLANDLLFMSRLEGGIPHKESVSISVRGLLEAVVEQMAPLMKDRQLGLSLREGTEVRGDMDQLIRLFLNLIENAAKYTPRKGAIDVTLTREDGMAMVSISNTGDGIPGEHLPHIFDRFYRVRNDRSRNSGGAGLGLAIAREIARGHGGDISVRSAAGGTTTFTVTLPIDPSRKEA